MNSILWWIAILILSLATGCVAFVAAGWLVTWIVCHWPFMRHYETYPCPVCGYDIRVTPHLCPECGTKLRWGMLPEDDEAKPE